MMGLVFFKEEEERPELPLSHSPLCEDIVEDGYLQARKKSHWEPNLPVP